MARPFDTSGRSTPPSPRTSALNFQIQGFTRHLEKLIKMHSKELHERLDNLERDKRSHERRGRRHERDEKTS